MLLVVIARLVLCCLLVCLWVRCCLFAMISLTWSGILNKFQSNNPTPVTTQTQWAPTREGTNHDGAQQIGWKLHEFCQQTKGFVFFSH